MLVLVQDMRPLALQWRRCGLLDQARCPPAPRPNGERLLLHCCSWAENSNPTAAWRTPAVCVCLQETLRTALAMGADRAIHVQVRLASRRCTAVLCCDNEFQCVCCCGVLSCRVLVCDFLS